MHILESYIKALNDLDADALAACFAEDCLFEDKAAPSVLRVEGRENLRALFTKAFQRKPGEMIATIYSLKGNTMEYDCLGFGGQEKQVHSRCVGTALLEDGLIKEYYVRKRENLHPLERYIQALNTLDANALADCFAEDAVFDDRAAATPIYFEGREVIRETFTKFFSRPNYKMTAAMWKLDGNTMDYDCISGSAGENHSVCRGTAILNREGLISEYRVRPRKD